MLAAGFSIIPTQRVNRLKKYTMPRLANNPKRLIQPEHTPLTSTCLLPKSMKQFCNTII